jgi:DNA repair protein RadC
MDRRVLRPSVAENTPPGAPISLERRADSSADFWDRFWTHGDRGLLDEDFLALFLTLHLPIVQARIQAAALMQRFEHLGDVLAASSERLMSQGGLDHCSAQDIKFAEAMLRRVAQARTRRRPVSEIGEAILGYLRLVLGNSPIVKAVVLYLDRGLRVIDVEEHARGTVSGCRVYPREIAKRCLQLEASAVIIGVSRPCGDHGFRVDDLNLVRSITFALRSLEIEIYDYLVVSSTGNSSMLSAGMLHYPRILCGSMEQGDSSSAPFNGMSPGLEPAAGE